MLKKIFTNTAFFIFIFTVISIIADIHYHHKLTYREPEKKGWTCWCDFKVFWTAGYRMNNYAFPLAVTIYPKSYEYELEIIDYLGYNRNRVYDKSEPFYHFRYAPLTIFLMVPFALIIYPANALMVWFIMLNIALMASLLLLTRQISLDFNISRSARYIILWGIFIVSLRFYLMNISNGQFDAINALFFVLLLMAYVRNNEIVCGIIFALIVQFKPLFLPMLVYFLFIGKKRLVLSAFLGSLALFFAPAMIIGFDKAMALLKDWMGMLNPSVSSQILNDKNQSITYFIGRSLLRIDALKSSISVERLFYILSAIFTVSAYIALLLFKRSLKAAGDKKFKYLEISLLIIITLLFSPLAWIAHFTCLIIPSAAILLFLQNIRNRRPLYIALGGFFILSMMVGTDITNFIPGLYKIRFINIALGTIFLMYVLIHSYKQQSKQS